MIRKIKKCKKIKRISSMIRLSKYNEKYLIFLYILYYNETFVDNLKSHIIIREDLKAK